MPKSAEGLVLSPSLFVYVVRLGEEGAGFCSHRSFVTQPCAGMRH